MKLWSLFFVAALFTGCRVVSVPTSMPAPAKASATEIPPELFAIRMPVHAVRAATLIADYRKGKMRWPKSGEIALPEGASRLVFTEEEGASASKNLAVAIYDTIDRLFRFEITPAGEVLAYPTALELLSR